MRRDAMFWRCMESRISARRDSALRRVESSRVELAGAPYRSSLLFFGDIKYMMFYAPLVSGPFCGREQVQRTLRLVRDASTRPNYRPILIRYGVGCFSSRVQRTNYAFSYKFGNSYKGAKLRHCATSLSTFTHA